jgi:hypothetical protein
MSSAYEGGGSESKTSSQLGVDSRRAKLDYILTTPRDANDDLAIVQLADAPTVYVLYGCDAIVDEIMVSVRT